MDYKLCVYHIRAGHMEKNGETERWLSCPNEAGGVSVRFCFQNTGGKCIRRVRICFTAYSRGDEQMQCRFKQRAEAWAEYMGQVPPGGFVTNYLFANASYNQDIAYARVEEAEIEYTDDSVLKLSRGQIDRHIPKDAPYAGCYIATAVYGSYDCPEVWTLRRFRDEVLAETWYGRLFIRLYYTVSPTAVELFGDSPWFRSFFRERLDRMVAGLQESGFESTPYQDMTW